MPGHAPFLGQVRLIRSPWLGQEGILLPISPPIDPEGFMPYNGLFFSELLRWSAPCAGDLPTVMFLSDKFKAQYFGNKEVSRETQGRILLSDAERALVKSARECVSKSCVQIGTVKSWMVDDALRLREEQETKDGRTVIRIPTGKIYAPGSRSEAHEMTVWSCPSAPDTEAPPALPQETTGAPEVPSKTFPVVPVVGGLAVAGLAAFLLLR